MNKTVSIHLAGTQFYMDETAYQKLSEYLDKIKRKFSDANERQEIMADIEARIAELFLEKGKNERHVVQIEDVEEIIKIMGKPDDYVSDSEEEYTDRESHSGQIPKKLYRDPDHKVLGGVSGGLAHYFNIDVVWVRLIWVLLVLAGLGSGIIVYIVLWAILPEAKSTSEKLAMKGISANIENIERKVKKKFEEISDKINQADFKKTGETVKEGVKSGLEGLGDVVAGLVRFVVKAAGILLMIVAMSVLVAMTVTFFVFLFVNAGNTPWGMIIEQTGYSDIPTWLIILAVFLAVCIPFFYIFQSGLSLLAGKTKSIGSVANIGLLTIWVLSVAALVSIGLREAQWTVFQEESTSEISRTLATSDTLIVNLNQSSENYNRRNRFWGDFVKDKNKYVFLNRNIQLHLKSSVDSTTVLEVFRTAQGPDERTAMTYAEQIDYPIEIKGDTLVLSDYFLSKLSRKAQNEKIRVNLYLPEKLVIKLNPEVKRIYTQHAGDLSYVSFDQFGEFLTLKAENLVCETCDN